MNHLLPLPISWRPWSELQDHERGFFILGEDDPPLHPNHVARLGRLELFSARRVWDWAYSGFTHGWPEGIGERFRHEEMRSVTDVWGVTERVAEIRRWLHSKGIPFSRPIYLLYTRDQVVFTTWQLLVKFWDVFGWTVGYAMTAVDHTRQWACCFHHEDLIVFGTNSSGEGE